MLRIVLFLVLIALAAAGAAWVADQPGDLVLTAGAFRATTTLPGFRVLAWPLCRGSRAGLEPADDGLARAGASAPPSS